MASTGARHAPHAGRSQSVRGGHTPKSFSRRASKDFDDGGPLTVVNAVERRRMKVCDLALYSHSTSSGVRTYIESKIDYVRQRPELDHVVIVPGAADEVAYVGRTKVLTVAGHRSPYPGVHIAWNIAKVARLIEREAPDVIELNCQYTLPWAAFLATRRRRVPVVGVYHTDVPACARHWAKPAGTFLSSAVERVVERYAGLVYRHCTVTILLTDLMRARMARLGVLRPQVLPCGVDTSTFHPDRRSAAFRRLHGVRPDQTLVLYAGRLSREKEVDVLRAAFERLPADRFVLMVAGDGPDASEFRRYAVARRGVRYLGHLASRADLATAFASSDVFVTPGRYETFGMSTLEALCSGLSIVGIRDSGTASLVPSELGVMTPAGDDQAMAAAIGRVASRSNVATREACHRFAARFSWDRVLDEYVSVYRRVMDGPAALAEVPA